MQPIRALPRNMVGPVHAHPALNKTKESPCGQGGFAFVQQPIHTSNATPAKLSRTTA
jgi:hypothetical protein